MVLTLAARDEMDRATWLRSDDPAAMLAALRSSRLGPWPELDRQIHRYYLACCRRIWPLLPGDAIRLAIEASERRIEGELAEQEWDEAATRAEIMYLLDVSVGKELAEEARRAGAERIGMKDHEELHYLVRYERWVGVIAEIPGSRRRKLVRTPPGSRELNPDKILLRAASFAFDVVHHGGGGLLENWGEHARFLSAHLLRESLEYPFVPEPNR